VEYRTKKLILTALRLDAWFESNLLMIAVPSSAVTDKELLSNMKLQLSMKMMIILFFVAKL